MKKDNKTSPRPAITVNEAHQALETEFPDSYASDAQSQQTVTVYLRDAINKENISYRPQDFRLPSPVDADNLYALIGRQSKQHVAIAHLKFGFEKLAELIKRYPALSDDLMAIYQSDRLQQELSDFVYDQEGDFGGVTDLQSVSNRHFPFTPVNPS